MIDACATHRTQFAVLSTDLVRFKEVNDVFGHELGDEAAAPVASRPAGIAASAARSIARLSGDEFGLIVDGTQPAAGVAIAEAAQHGAGAGSSSSTTRSCVSASTGGIADAIRATARRRRPCSPTPMPRSFRAKVEARGSICVFEPEMDQQIARPPRACTAISPAPSSTASCRCTTSRQAEDAAQGDRLRGA